VIGDPVNEAARLTELAKQREGRLLASSAVIERAGAEEAERWSGRDAEVELPSEPEAGAAILACSPENVARLGTRGFIQIGEVR